MHQCTGPCTCETSLSELMCTSFVPTHCTPWTSEIVPSRHCCALSPFYKGACADCCARPFSPWYRTILYWYKCGATDFVHDCGGCQGSRSRGHAPHIGWPYLYYHTNAGKCKPPKGCKRWMCRDTCIVPVQNNTGMHRFRRFSTTWHYNETRNKPAVPCCIVHWMLLVLRVRASLGSARSLRSYPHHPRIQNMSEKKPFICLSKSSISPFPRGYRHSNVTCIFSSFIPFSVYSNISKSIHKRFCTNPLCLPTHTEA